MEQKSSKGWEYLLSRTERLILIEVYANLKYFKLAGTEEKKYALKSLTLQDSTFIPPWSAKAPTPLRLTCFVADQTSEYPLDEFKDKITKLNRLEELTIYRNKKAKTEFLHKFGSQLKGLQKLRLDE